MTVDCDGSLKDISVKWSQSPCWSLLFGNLNWHYRLSRRFRVGLRPVETAHILCIPVDFERWACKSVLNYRICGYPLRPLGYRIYLEWTKDSGGPTRQLCGRRN